MHSPPWTAPLRVSDRNATELRDAKDDLILGVFTRSKRDVLPALAHAANCHDALVAALKKAEVAFEDYAHPMRDEVLPKIRAALALAGGES